MGQYTVTLTQEEEKALLTVMVSIQEWVDNAIHNRARQAIDDIVTKSGKGSKFTSVADKIKIINELTMANSVLLKTAEEKNKEIV